MTLILAVIHYYRARLNTRIILTLSLFYTYKYTHKTHFTTIFKISSHMCYFFI